jgi:hypothetical protein
VTLRIASRLVNQFDGFCRRLLAVGSINDFEARNVEIELRRKGLDLVRRAYEYRLDDAGNGGLAHPS